MTRPEESQSKADEDLAAKAGTANGELPPPWTICNTLDQSALPRGAEPVAAGQSFGSYDLIAEIARGGMGVVYKAYQRSLKRTVALKMILEGQLASDESVQRFFQEAQAAAGLDHPNIVPIYEVGEHAGRHFFTMALVEGPSLEKWVRHKGLPAPAAAAALVVDVATAVAHAHGQGIIHRDLKPDNVLLDKDGRPRVTDFGLAKSLAGSGRTASGQVLGTPSYMPPEQATGDIHNLGPAADVYSLGGILYFLLTGKPPFDGHHIMQVLHQVVHDAPVPPRRWNPSVPADLEAVCLKCLEKEPAQRYASAAELAEALEPLAATANLKAPKNSGPTDPVPPNSANAPTQPLAAPPRPRGLLAAVAVLGLLLLGGGGYLVYTHVRKPNDGPAGGATKDTSGPATRDNGSLDHMVLVPKISHRDFGLEIKLLDAAKGEDGAYRLKEGQATHFRVKAERDGYLGLWNIAPDGTITQFFPNDYEPDNKVKAGVPRLIPGDQVKRPYRIRARPGGLEQVWVVVATEPWKAPESEVKGPFVIFRSLDTWRDFLPEPVGHGQVAEDLFKYRVVPIPAGRK